MKRTNYSIRYSRMLLLLLFMVLGTVSAWAQPNQILVIDDETLACEGKVRLKFAAGVDEGSDDYVTYAQLYVNDGVGERELLYIANTKLESCTGATTDQNLFESWCYSNRSSDQASYGSVESITSQREGDNYFFVVTIGNLRRRTENNLNFRLRWSWDGDSDFSDQDTRKTVDKKSTINAIFTSAFRDDCNPNEVRITANANVACNKSGFKYRMTIQKSTSADFSSPTTLVDKKIYESANVGSSIVEEITDITSAQVFYKSIIEYVNSYTRLEYNNGVFTAVTEELVYQKVESIVTPVQQFSVAPPALAEVSKDICNNRIKLKWQYNAAEANSFNIYRASGSDTYLQFDGNGDYIEVLNSTNISPATTGTMTIEALVRVDKIGASQTIIQNGSFFLYIANGVLKGSVGDARLRTLTGGALPLNSWVHIALSASWLPADNFFQFNSLYVNGEKVDEVEYFDFSTSLSVPSFSQTVKIGIPDPYPNPAGFLEFQGGINNVRIWNGIYTSIDPNRVVSGTESDLVMFFDFQEGVPNANNSGISQVRDRSANQYVGQLNGFALQGTNSNFGATFVNHQKIASVDGKTLEYEDNQNIVSNQPYEYYITAIKTCGGNTNESLPSNSISGFSPTTPAAPTGLTTVANSTDNTIRLNWTDNAFDETAYEIRRRFGDASTVFTIQPNDTLYVDNAVVDCRGYEYDVFAKNVCGLSNASAQGSARLEPNLEAILAADQFKGSKGAFMNRVEINWTAQGNTKIDRYRVYRKVLGTTDSVQIDVVSGNTNLYRDENAEVGVLYEYTLVGEVDCDGDVLRSNTVATVGYRAATALVSGQITYAGGNAVEGAKVIIAQADGTQIGKSLNFDGINDKVVFDSINWMNQSFTIEFWAKRDNANAATIFAQGNSMTAANENLNIGFNASGNFVFGFGSNDLTTTPTYNTTDWQHWTCVYDVTTNKRSIYKNDSLVLSDTPSATYAGKGKYQLGATLQNTNFFAGQLDELRIWNTAKDSATVARDYNRILNGNEANIFATYSLDEGIGYGVYDRSKTGLINNQRHGQVMGATNLRTAWSMTIPTSDQLSLYGLTDASGSYIVAAIPYSGAGQVFKVVPQLGTHRFEPSQRNLFIGVRSDVFNGTNFNDISSFPVTGTVFYKGTSCPADQIEIQIDGVTATLNGNKVMTSSDGAFTVDVPIGRHRISLFKAGHQFEVGQFPTNGSLFDFQEPVSGLEFIDATTLKVIGRVVGGTREADKVPGLGRSVNNIGRARVVYEALVGNGCHQDTVFTDSQTGEYVTQLYPLKYVVKDVRVTNPSQNISTSDFFDALPQIDLVNVFEEKTAKDSVFTAGTNTIERIDSVKYNYRQDFVYRKTAELTVLNEDRINPFIGEKEFLFNSTKLDLTNANMRYPVFKRFGQYKAYISAFEQYQNFDAGAPIQTDKVPVTDGKLVINNQIARPTEEVIEINLTDGDTLYTFITGRPEIVVNNSRPEFSYTQTLDITLQRPGQVEDVKWEPNTGIALEDRVFRAYVIGYDDIVGSNFVSQGPEVVKFVLRDPPGDNSTATFTEETEIGWTESLSVGGELSTQFGAKIGAGVDATIGVGTATNVTATVATNTNIQIDFGITASGELSQTWTSSESYSTNDANEAVGVRSDLYVGETYNVIFGVTNNLEFIPNEVCNTVDLECIEIHASLPFKIGVRKGFTMSPSDTKTTFIYDQNYILNYLIPNLKTLRNNLFISNPQKYISKLLPSDDNYGKNNDDRVWGMAVTDQSNVKKKAILDSLKAAYGGNINNIPEIKLAKTYLNNPFTTERSDSTGMSYTWKPINSTDFDNGKPVYGIGTDSVRFYNQAIRLWEEAIRDNEKDKILAINNPATYRTRNISINAGTAFASEESYSSGNSIGVSIEFSAAKNFVTTTKAATGGNEVESELEQSYTFKLESEVSRSSQTTTTWAYEIKDVEQGDFHNIEVYKSPAGWGPIFRTIAGQTACPHEGGDVTLFYTPGAKLNERTLQRDKVAIDIFPKIVQNVPEGEAAVFNVQFKNISETNDARFYAVRVDPSSNPDGLNIAMDGETITVENGFAMPGGAVQTKVITVERGPEKYEYKDIRLLFYAPCQYEAGTADEVDIVDTVTFSVSFLPECTNIRLKEPTDLWVLNNFNLDTLPITIDNYDINKSGFESISLQYRPASEATWRELNKWWHPTNKANEMGDKIPLTSSFIRYDWDMSSNVDGPYQLRVVSGCELVSKETEFKKGTADRINPTPFGTPSPGDGISDPGEDLKIRFNEMVDIGSLTSLNFDIRGVLNGTPLRNSESVAFDGSNDYIAIPAFDLTKRAFAVEFWAKRNSTGVGTVFSQGSSAGQGLFIGFDATNHFQFSFAGQTLTSTETIPTGEWKHFVASFDFDSKTAVLFIDGVEKKVSNSFTVPYESTGEIRVGQTQADGSKSFNGNIYELRLWSRSRSTSEIVPNFNIALSPTTSGLMGYWQMNEGVGTLVADKVRKRNGVLNGATWAISPVGRAFSFNGSSDYLELTNGGLLNFSEETSMTIELWFKGTTAGTLLSNGKGDGSDTKTSWTFSLDANGKIVVRNNGETFESNTSGYLDNNWHHLAIVLERNAAINLYLDGQLQKTGSSNIWKGFAGAKLWIGARGGFVGGAETRDQYFNGSLDDIRLWNLARRPEQIGRDWVNRLSGDELGLVAYYPFEAYRLDAGVPVLDVSLADQSMNSFDLTQGGGTALNYVQPTPPIKLQRPIEKVNFNYIVNDDEIILTPTDPSSRLEHVTLDVTVRGVKDAYGNIMQSPATWIAFMNKNQVNWDRSDIELVQEFGQTRTFEALVVNSGGSEENFQILNLPSWLSASPSTGTIAPNSQLTVKFTISNAVNIGKYEQDLFLSTDFGFNERLTLNLKVSAVPPTWTINSSQFQHTMSYVGQLQIENIISTDTEDQLAVFVNNELRGVTNVVLDNISNKYLVFLDVFSNTVAGETLEFRIWDASEGKVRVPVNPTDQMFTLHEFIGTRTNPQIFSANNSIEQAYSLNSGWNWISFPLSSSILMDVNETLDGLTPVENDRILSQQYFDTYTANEWVGSLSSTGNGFNRKELYKVYLTNPGTFTYNGTFDAPASDPIAIGTGWNWIGFISQQNMEINTALASLSPSNGDVIKGQRTFAVYETGLGWGGSLTYLEPTQGYMLRMANTGTLIYPAPSSLTTPTEALVKASNQLIVLEEQLNVEPATHLESMSIVGTIADCGQFSLKEQTYLAAFVGGECRGIAPIVRAGKSWRTYLTVHGSAEEQIHFQLLEGNKSKMVKLKNQIVFEAAQLLGMPSAPYLFELDINCNIQPAIASLADDNISDVSIYPNPFDSKILVDLNLAQAEKVTVSLQDVNGKTVGVLYSGELGAGKQQISWNADSKAALGAGIYFLHIQADSIYRIEKIVKAR